MSFSTLVCWPNKNKSCMIVDETGEAGVCIGVFLAMKGGGGERIQRIVRNLVERI